MKTNKSKSKQSSTKAKKKAIKKPADRRAAPKTKTAKTRIRVEALVSKTERTAINKAAKSKGISVSQMIKNWIKSLIK